MEELMNRLLQEMQSLKLDINLVNERTVRMEQNQERMAVQLDSIYQSVVRIEDGQLQDIIAILENIQTNISDKDFEIAALNRRIFRLESDFEKINRQEL